MSADLPRMHDHPCGDKPARQRFISRSLPFTVPLAAGAIALAFAFPPAIAGMELPAERLALAARWLLVAALPYFAVCLHILAARFLEGSHDPLRGAESERLKIHGRVMQNTLEQLVWFAIVLLALASLVQPRQAGVIPVLCLFFLVARAVYWWGYLRDGTLGRAPGVQLTFTLNIALLVYALVLFTLRG